MDLPRNLTFVDVETSGMSAQFGKIIEIGIVRVENGIVTKTFETLLNPFTYIDPFIERLTGIHSEELQTAPLFHDKSDEILELFEDSLFVAHNAQFDYAFIKQEFLRIGVEFRQKRLCTVQLARILYPQLKRFSLDSIIAWGGFACENRHRAFSDAQVLWNFYQRALTDHGEEKVSQAIQRVVGTPNIPAHLKDSVKKLPESAGVYLFYGEDGSPLYIGKSINIRDRVLSHFAAASRNSTDMKLSDRVASIEWRTTPGELTALLLESTLIKDMQPIHNKQLRRSRQLLILKEKTDSHGYRTAYLEVITGELTSVEHLLRICKSKRQAQTFLRELAEEHMLCPRLLELEKGSGPCFSYHLKKCNGACDKKELPAKYNLRFEDAFYKYKIKRWPFKGPILIHEGIDDHEEYLLVDDWCYLGKVTSENDLLEQKTQEYHFDYDTYKLLAGFISTRKNKKYIRQMPTRKVKESSYEDAAAAYV